VPLWEHPSEDLLVRLLEDLLAHLSSVDQVEAALGHLLAHPSEARTAALVVRLLAHPWVNLLVLPLGHLLAVPLWARQ
jgi:hypothetical protein